MSKKFLIFIKATMLAIGLSACGATTDTIQGVDTSKATWPYLA